MVEIAVSGEVDKFGIDPLRMAMFQAVDEADSVNVRVNAAFAGNPQAISFKQFGTNAYWQYILIANGLVHPSEVVAGMLLRVPTSRPVIAATKKITRTTI